MKLFSLVAASAALTPVVLGAPHLERSLGSSKTPACSMEHSAPCECPADLYYYETTTMAIVGTSMKNARNLLNDFYETKWYDGTLPNKTQGPDNKPGSIRTFNYVDSTGIEAAFSEQLLGFNVYPNGAFLQQYQQYITPEAAKNGTVPGFYVRLAGRPTFMNETVVSITAWGCWQGAHPTLTASHVNGLKNALKILKKEDKLTGITPSHFLSTAYFAD